MSQASDTPSLTPTIYDANTVERIVDEKLQDMDNIVAENVTATDTASTNILVINGWAVTVVE